MLETRDEEPADSPAIAPNDDFDAASGDRNNSKWLNDS